MKKRSKKNVQSHSAPLTKALTKYLHLDDPWVVDVALASIVTNLSGEEPFWLLLVNPPSTGKTELVQMFKEVETCAWLAEVTENLTCQVAKEWGQATPTLIVGHVRVTFRDRRN